MKKKYCGVIGDAIIKACNYGSNLTTLIWNFDLQKSPSTAKKFLIDLVDTENIRLNHISMTGVFNTKDNRDLMRKIYDDSGIELILF